MVGISKLYKISIAAILFISSSACSYAMGEKSQYLDYSKDSRFRNNLELCFLEANLTGRQANRPKDQPVAIHVPEEKIIKITNSKSYRQDDLNFRMAVNNHIHNLLLTVEEQNPKEVRLFHDITNTSASAKPRDSIIQACLPYTK